MERFLNGLGKNGELVELYAEETKPQGKGGGQGHRRPGVEGMA
jgi:hypothetical protein